MTDYEKFSYKKFSAKWLYGINTYVAAMGLHFLRGAGADELRETASEGFTLFTAVMTELIRIFYPSFNSSPKQGEV